MQRVEDLRGQEFRLQFEGMLRQLATAVEDEQNGPLSHPARLTIVGGKTALP